MKLRRKRCNSGRGWLKRSVSTSSRSLMLLSFTVFLSSCTQEDTVGAGKTIIESEYSEETGEIDNTSRTQEDTIDASKPITEPEYPEETGELYHHLTTSNFIRDVVNHPALKDSGNSMLPRDDNTAYYDTRLTNVASLLPYHNHVDPDIVVGAINYMIDEVSDGKAIFYDFYTDEQKQQDPNKRNTGLFFFRGNPDAPYAIVCPGGGFSYVGSLHEGFPLALEISKKGYNAFVIRYRIGSEQQAAEDLAAAIAYIFRNAEILQVSTRDYALWGGSAGARMVGDIALNGVAAYGGGNLPKPATAVIAYTGQSSYSRDFSPAFITVAANDGIVNINTVERRVENLKNAGVDVEYRRYQSAGHGFGLGTGTDAEGWVDLAVQFWQRYITGASQNEIPQQIYLWEEDNVPTTTEYTENNAGYFDPPDFRPNMVYLPVKQDVAVKGAVLVCAGGAFQFRGNEMEGTPVAEHLSALGYQSFVVNYRLRPYTMQEGALDLARAVRYVRSRAADLGIEENDIAVVGFSAGGILAGELALNFDGTINGTAIDPDYMPDALDRISADVSAVGMIYSFYGRLSVASTDVEKFRASDLPPTYFLYGTRDPFVRQFEACVSALQQAGVPVESHALEGWPHGFGAGDGQWILDFDKWLSEISNH
jgi:acetyl esterase/lipase